MIELLEMKRGCMYLHHKFTCAGNTSLFSYNSFYFKFPFHQVYQSEDSKKTETAVGVSGRRGFNTGNKMLNSLERAGETNC